MPDAPGSPKAPPTITILNIDDNAANLYAITRMLQRGGFAVVEATGGEEGLAKVASLRPDLVVLDVNMPDLDGLEVCRRIKADPATSSIPVLHMSASYILSEDKTRGLDQGSDAYLIRPVEPPELIATVRALLRIRAAEMRANTAALEWKATFNAIGDGVCLIDREGRVIRSNRAAEKIFGLEPGAILGRAFRELVVMPEPPDDLALGDRWFRAVLHPIPEEGAVCTLIDVTDRRKFEDEYRKRADAFARKQRSEGEAILNLAKEIREPLVKLRHLFDQIKLDDPSGEDNSAVRQLAEDQFRHLLTLVDERLGGPPPAEGPPEAR